MLNFNPKTWPTSGSLMFIGKEAEPAALFHAKTLLQEGSPRSAALLESNTHPDFKIVSRETNAQWIKVDQVREFIAWAVGKPQIAHKKVGVIASSHTLNLQSANALLKTLEEPSINTVFILITDRPFLLPATIYSRCHKIKITSKENRDNIFQSELKTNMIKILQELQLKKTNPLFIAEQWVKEDIKQILYWLLVILYEFARHEKKNQAFWSLVDTVLQGRRAVVETQPNVQLLLEDILIQYQESSGECL